MCAQSSESNNSKQSLFIAARPSPITELGSFAVCSFTAYSDTQTRAIRKSYAELSPVRSGSSLLFSIEAENSLFSAKVSDSAQLKSSAVVLIYILLLVNLFFVGI